MTPLFKKVFVHSGEFKRLIIKIMAQKKLTIHWFEKTFEVDERQIVNWLAGRAYSHTPIGDKAQEVLDALEITFTEENGRILIEYGTEKDLLTATQSDN